MELTWTSRFARLTCDSGWEYSFVGVVSQEGPYKGNGFSVAVDCLVHCVEYLYMELIWICSFYLVRN